MLGASALPAATLSTTACSSGPQPVATDPDLARDPLASTDPALWDVRSAADMVGLPIEGDLAEFEAWGDAALDDSSVASTRQQLVDFLGVAYLDPDGLADRRHGEVLAAIEELTPEFWKDNLAEAWSGGGRHFYAYTLNQPFADVSAPHIAANWYRAQQGDVPQLALTGTIARTVIDTESREVGVVAQRYGMKVDLGAQGEALRGSFQVTLHGIDLCATGEANGLHVPAISADAAHQAVQDATMDQVIASPRVSIEVMDSTSGELLPGDENTVLLCD